MEPEELLAIYGYPLKDPAATCHACGALGTVGRAIRKVEEREVLHRQTCATCWPTEYRSLNAQWEAATNAWLTHAMNVRDSIEPSLRPHGQGAMGGATWDGVEAFVRDHIRPTQQSATPMSRVELGAIAAQYQQLEPELVGEMPQLVRTFIRDYAGPVESTVASTGLDSATSAATISRPEGEPL